MTRTHGRGRLDGWRVLVPRGGAWGDRVAGLLAGEGARAVVVPLIAFAPPQDVDALDAAVGRLAAGAYDWLAVTSGTTVTALAERVPAVLGPQARLADLLDRTRVAAVGPGTARVLGEHGVTAALLPSGERSGAGLVAEMAPLAARVRSRARSAPATEGRAVIADDAAGRGAGGAGAADGGGGAGADGAAARGQGPRVLVPHSDLAEPTVVDGLRSAGWAVEEVVAYRTVPGPPPDGDVVAAWRAGAIGAVLLSSASTVRNLVDLLGAPSSSVVVCCIGSRTEAEARRLGLRVHVRPANASAEELVEALATHVTPPAADPGPPVDPDPEPAPEPLAAPGPDPEPLAAPGPDPEPLAAPGPDPEPLAAPTPAPAPAPAPDHRSIP